ncbi:MAG: PorP/SprF family type IX secretion system membrane protein, partial [Flavobacteriales bacterium]|nr:PorP/SprF family type IX secretion system membrane protein [Flavobacteriales bacterium]
YLVSADHYFFQQNMGMGILFGQDVSGSGGLKRTVINLQFAPEIQVSRKFVLRFGAQAGIGMVRVNWANLLFGDQIVRGGGVPTLENFPENRSYFDMGGGVLGYSKDFWFGISANHLIKPNEALVDEYGKSVLPLKVSVHGGYKLVLNPGVKDEYNRETLSPTFNYRAQEKFDQLDFCLYYSRSVLNLGIWYRGLPGFKSYQTGYSNHDAIGLIIGLKTDRFGFGYSYDFTISKLSNASAGAHEITMSFHFCDPNKKKRKRIVVDCPRF